MPQPTFYKAVKQLHSYTDALINRALESHDLQKQSSDEATTDERYVLLHELIRLTQDRQQLRDELLGVFFAGRNTTSALLSHLFFVLARNPDVWQQLRMEVDQLKGAKPTSNDLKAMKYLGFCLNEGQTQSTVFQA